MNEDLRLIVFFPLFLCFDSDDYEIMRRRNDNDKDTEERARTEFVSCSLRPLCLALMMSSFLFFDSS